MEDYRSLMQRLQDLEDALDLDRAVETATDFREYTEIRAERLTRQEGNLMPSIPSSVMPRKTAKKSSDRVSQPTVNQGRIRRSGC